jgi:uncharacterized cupredoxin-like copper-binding protein
MTKARGIAMRTHVAAVAFIVLFAGAGVGLAACTAQTTVTTATTATPGVQTITVTLTDTTMNASQATVQSGVRYHFIVTNQGAHPHQFWLSPQGMAQMMGRMPMAQWRQQILYGSQDIGPGMMTSFDYTFTRQMMHQGLAYGCYTANGQSVIQMPIRVNP